jgi:hypothetical protein
MHRTPLFALALAACGATDAPDPSAEAAAAAASALCELYTAAGQSCTAQGATANGPVSLTVTATVGTQAEVGGRALLDLAFDLAVDGAARPALSCGGSGQAADMTAAVAQAVDQWAQRCGAPIVDGLVDSGASAALGEKDGDGELLSLTMGSWHAYPGKVTMLGQLKGGPGGNHQMLLSFLEPALGGLSGPAPHLVHIELTVQGQVASDAQCSVDGVASPALCEAARGFPWPEGQPAYVVKQTYAFTPGAEPPPPGVPDAPAEGEGKAGKGKAGER